MNIDWVTVIAMIVNFLVLVFLLHRFLYGPILRVIDEREQKITRREAEAAAKTRFAEAEAARFREKESALREQANEHLEKARVAAEAEQRQLIAAARREVEATRRQWEKAFYRERDTFVQELRREMGRQACLIARRGLRDLAGADLEEMTWSVFMDKLQRLDPDEEAKLREALSRADRRAVARGAFAVSEKKLEHLRNNLAKRFPPGIDLDYEVSPGLICGLELDTGDYRLGWNVDSYLEGVEKRILQELEQGSQGEEQAQEKEAAPDG